MRHQDLTRRTISKTFPAKPRVRTRTSRELRTIHLEEAVSDRIRKSIRRRFGDQDIGLSVGMLLIGNAEHLIVWIGPDDGARIGVGRVIDKASQPLYLTVAEQSGANPSLFSRLPGAIDQAWAIWSGSGI